MAGQMFLLCIFIATFICLEANASSDNSSSTANDVASAIAKAATAATTAAAAAANAATAAANAAVAASNAAMAAANAINEAAKLMQATNQQQQKSPVEEPTKTDTIQESSGSEPSAQEEPSCSCSCKCKSKQPTLEQTTVTESLTSSSPDATSSAINNTGNTFGANGATSVASNSVKKEVSAATGKTNKYSTNMISSSFMTGATESQRPKSSSSERNMVLSSEGINFSTQKTISQSLARGSSISNEVYVTNSTKQTTEQVSTGSGSYTVKSSTSMIPKETQTEVSPEEGNKHILQTGTPLSSRQTSSTEIYNSGKSGMIGKATEDTSTILMSQYASTTPVTGENVTGLHGAQGKGEETKMSSSATTQSKQMKSSTLTDMNTVKPVQCPKPKNLRERIAREVRIFGVDENGCPYLSRHETKPPYKTTSEITEVTPFTSISSEEDEQTEQGMMTSPLAQETETTLQLTTEGTTRMIECPKPKNLRQRIAKEIRLYGVDENGCPYLKRHSRTTPTTIAGTASATTIVSPGTVTTLLTESEEELFSSIPTEITKGTINPNQCPKPNNWKERIAKQLKLYGVDADGCPYLKSPSSSTTMAVNTATEVETTSGLMTTVPTILTDESEEDIEIDFPTEPTTLKTKQMTTTTQQSTKGTTMHVECPKPKNLREQIAKQTRMFGTDPDGCPYLRRHVTFTTENTRASTAGNVSQHTISPEMTESFSSLDYSETTAQPLQTSRPTAKPVECPKPKNLRERIVYDRKLYGVDENGCAYLRRHKSPATTRTTAPSTTTSEMTPQNIGLEEVSSTAATEFSSVSSQTTGSTKPVECSKPKTLRDRIIYDRRLYGVDANGCPYLRRHITPATRTISSPTTNSEITTQSRLEEVTSTSAPETTSMSSQTTTGTTAPVVCPKPRNLREQIAKVTKLYGVAPNGCPYLRRPKSPTTPTTTTEVYIPAASTEGTTTKAPCPKPKTLRERIAAEIELYGNDENGCPYLHKQGSKNLQRESTRTESSVTTIPAQITSTTPHIECPKPRNIREKIAKDYLLYGVDDNGCPRLHRQTTTV